MESLWFAQLFRQECSTCGSTFLEWATSAEAAAVFGIEWAAGVVAMVPAQERSDAAVWRCLSCGDGGAFGATFRSL